MKEYKYIVSGYFLEPSYYEYSERHYFEFYYDTLEKAVNRFKEMKMQYPSHLILTVKTEEVIMDIREKDGTLSG